MDKNITIRKAETGDIERIKTILFSSLKEYEIHITDNYAVTDIDSLNAEHNTAQVFVIVGYESLLGFVVLKPITEDCIELKRLYIASVHRGRGLGEYLLDYAIRFAYDHKYKSIRLETTSKFKEAVSLYKKHGFVELKHIQKAPGHDLAFEKDLTL